MPSGADPGRAAERTTRPADTRRSAPMRVQIEDETRPSCGHVEPSKFGPALDFAAAEDEAGDAKLKRLPGIPRVVGRGEQFEDAGDRGALTAAKAG